jgi:hypothetical protein
VTAWLTGTLRYIRRWCKIIAVDRELHGPLERQADDITLLYFCGRRSFFVTLSKHNRRRLIDLKQQADLLPGNVYILPTTAIMSADPAQIAGVSQYTTAANAPKVYLHLHALLQATY